MEIYVPKRDTRRKKTAHKSFSSRFTSQITKTKMGNLFSFSFINFHQLQIVELEHYSDWQHKDYFYHRMLNQLDLLIDLNSLLYRFLRQYDGLLLILITNKLIDNFYSQPHNYFKLLPGSYPPSPRTIPSFAFFVDFIIRWFCQSTKIFALIYELFAKWLLWK